jgi:hypothetical protein
LPVPTLPAEPEAAAVAVIDAVWSHAGIALTRQGESGEPAPGWLQRRWAAEVAAFVSAVQSAIGASGQVVRTEAAPLAAAATQSNWAEGTVCFVILPPAPGVDDKAEMVVVQRNQTAAGDDQERVLLLSPDGPIAGPNDLRGYLVRCRTHVLAAFRTPLP